MTADPLETTQIIPGVHLVPGTRGSNVYLIEEATLTVIDTGLSHNAGAILRHIARLGRQPEDLVRIILTHHHLDHAGSAAELRTRTGADLLVHAADLDALERRGQSGQPAFEGFRGLWGRWVERLKAREEMPAAVPLRDGQVLPVLGGLTVVHTPDHTPGSICLYSRERSLVFVGDMVLNNVSRLSRPLPSFGSVPAVYDASLRRLASLDFEVCLFGHGPPILQGGSRLVREVAERPTSGILPLRIGRNLRTLLSFVLRLGRRHTGD